MVSKIVREVYDRSARRYAEANPNMRGGLTEAGARFLQMTWQMAGEQPRVLDLGCGAGRDMAWMEDQGVWVVGADLSAGMLEEARHSVRGPLVQADMRRLPFGDGSFNSVWCMASMLHLPKADAPSALAEIKRVLKPGGVLLLGLQMGEGEVWEPNPYGDGERFFARYSPEEAAEVVASAGFNRPDDASFSFPYRRWLYLITTRITK